jgi:hypothetical protein
MYAAAFALMMVAPMASAVTTTVTAKFECYDARDVFTGLKKKYNEVPVYDLNESATTNRYVVFRDSKSKSWTLILLDKTSSVACIIDSGDSSLPVEIK